MTNEPRVKLDASLLARAVPNGSMRYFAWLYASAQQRDVLAALFLIEAELHETAQAAHEVAHIRLQWWQEEVDCLIAGKARHPATKVLQDALRHLGFAQQPQLSMAEPLGVSNWRNVLHAAAQELAKATYETDVELDQYLRGGLGNLFALAVQLMAEASPAVVDLATRLGAFVRQVEISRDLRHDFHHGRLYLPLTALDAHDIEYQALHGPEWPASFVELLKTRSEQQLAGYKALQAQLFKQHLSNDERQSLRPLLVLSDLHARLLRTIAADHNAAQTRQRVELTPLQKVWTAWRAAFSVR